MQIDDRGRAARFFLAAWDSRAKAGMDEAALAELQSALSQSEASASTP
jgi:hypothetical protein